MIEIAKHFHEVELDLVRFELGISRTFSESLDASFRVPYLIREQTADVRFKSGTSAADMAAARRNGMIHHRTESYEGFSDPEFSVGWRTTGVPFFGERSVFRVSAGFTIPVGDTEEDPWLLADAGLEHLHVQFGNGTFDPIIDVYLGAPINEQLAWNVFAKARLPLYHNSKGYRGAPEVIVSPRISWLPTKKVSVFAGATGIYYGYSDWEKTGRDRNSGQLSFYANAGVGYKLTDELTASVTALLPFYTDSFSSEDGLDPAPTFSLSLGYSF